MRIPPEPFYLSVPVTTADHSIGRPDARVTIVNTATSNVQSANRRHRRFVVAQSLQGPSPIRLPSFSGEEVHPDAFRAAEAAECVGAQGKFWPMHDLLFEYQPLLKASHLRSYAERLQVDMTRYTADMDEHIYIQRIREQMTSGHKSGVRGTPGFFVNGAIQDISFGMEVLFAAVEEKLRM